MPRPHLLDRLADALDPHVDLRSLARPNPGPPRRWVALRAALSIGLPLVVATAGGWGTTGFLTSLGAFASIYGAGAAVRHRARVIAGVGLALCVGVTLGTLTAGHPWLFLLAIVGVTTVAGWGTYALRVGPPGAFFVALSTGVANAAATGGTEPALVVAMTAVGALVALVIGTSDGWFRRHGVEEAAVAHAERHVARFAACHEPDQLDQRRADASTALHAAWTAVSDGGSQDRFGDRLRQVHEQYVRTTAQLSARYAGLDLHPWDATPEPVDDTPVEHAGDLGRSGSEQREVESTQVRLTALGRPDAAYLLRQAAWWPSESLLVAARLALACGAAGALATLLENGHVYWAVSFAALIVTAGGSRRAQATKALHRVLGTGAGLAVYAALLALAPHGWWLVGVVVALQFLVELLVTRHYALAVSALTPLALLISTELTGAPTASVVQDRLLDTALGVGSALVVLVLSGLGGHEVVLRAHAHRASVAVLAVLEDLAAGREEGPDVRRRRQQLYVQLLESDAVARRALADAPGHIAPYREMERALSHVGYLVLGAGWHPPAERQPARIRGAADALAEHLARHPARARRPADELTAELREVERLLTGAR